MSFQGKPNQYMCNTCREAIVTVDRDEGVTPMFLACQMTSGCDGTMVSAGYTVPTEWATDATHEWYRPDADECATLSPGARDHVAQGGLLLRELVDVFVQLDRWLAGAPKRRAQLAQYTGGCLRVTLMDEHGARATAEINRDSVADMRDPSALFPLEHAVQAALRALGVRP